VVFSLGGVGWFPLCRWWLHPRNSGCPMQSWWLRVVGQTGRVGERWWPALRRRHQRSLGGGRRRPAASAKPVRAGRWAGFPLRGVRARILGKRQTKPAAIWFGGGPAKCRAWDWPPRNRFCSTQLAHSGKSAATTPPSQFLVRWPRAPRLLRPNAIGAGFRHQQPCLLLQSRRQGRYSNSNRSSPLLLRRRKAWGRDHLQTLKHRGLQSPVCPAGGTGRPLSARAPAFWRPPGVCPNRHFHIITRLRSSAGPLYRAPRQGPARGVDFRRRPPYRGDHCGLPFLGKRGLSPSGGLPAKCGMPRLHSGLRQNPGSFQWRPLTARVSATVCQYKRAFALGLEGGPPAT